MPFSSLPPELVERVLIACAAQDDPRSIAALAKTSRHYRATVYTPEDQHLWRSVYLAAFDDPRPALAARYGGLEVSPLSDDVRKRYGAFGGALGSLGDIDWGAVYRERISAAARYFVSPKEDKPAHNAVLSTVRDALLTALPFPPSVHTTSEEADALPMPSIFTVPSIDGSGFGGPFVAAMGAYPIFPPSPPDAPPPSRDVAWLRALFARGAPGGSSEPPSDPPPPTGITARAMSELLTPGDFASPPPFAAIGAGSNARAHHELLAHVGPLAHALGAERDDSGMSRALNSLPMFFAIPANGGRTELRRAARCAVYDMTYLRARRAWGPFQLVPPDARAVAEEEVGADGLGGVDAPSKPEEEGHAKAATPGTALQAEAGGSGAQAGAAGPGSIAGGDGQDGVANQGGAAANTVVVFHDELHDEGPGWIVEEDLQDGEPPLVIHHYDDDIDTDEEAPDDGPVGAGDDDDAPPAAGGPHVIEITLPAFGLDDGPGAALPPATMLEADWTFLGAARVLVEANLREAAARVRWEAGLDGVDLDGVAALHTGGDELARVRRQRLLEGIEVLTDLDGLRAYSAPVAPCPPDLGDVVTAPDVVDVHDWAGVNGVWRRCTCWLDFRELLRSQVLPPAQRFQGAGVQEAVYVMPMALRVVGRADLDDPALASSWPARPPLAFVGAAAGPWAGSPLRRLRGTAAMAGDGRVWWSFVFTDESGHEQWSSEGVQLGGVQSRSGILGLWSCANHEHADPLGPFWMWKVA